MFIAHLPAGYLLSRLASDPRTRLGILLGSVLPDVDLLWFYGPGERAVNHHFYLTHFAWFWLLVGLRFRGVATGALLHLALDTIAGGIAWLHPFSRELFVLWEVPPRDGFWVWSFVLHPTFLFELLIASSAFGLAGLQLLARSARSSIVTACTWRSARAPSRALPSTSPS